MAPIITPSDTATTHGANQDQAIPLYAGIQCNITQATSPFIDPINATPSTLKINPIELAVPNLKAFLRIKMKAFQAEAQKFLPVKAIQI